MIVEGIVTSLDTQARLNVAPMGAVVEGDFESLCLRPFQSSGTFRNLMETRCGVFHVVDTVDLLARTAIGRQDPLPPTRCATTVSGRILENCCRWFEFRIHDCDLTDERATMPAQIVARGSVRPFLGFNRARHAVLEAAILATRVHLLPEAQWRYRMAFLKPAVEKTGGPAEKEAFALLENHMTAFGQKSP